MNDSDLFDLVYNERSGDFETSQAKERDGFDIVLDSLFPTPPQRIEELIGGVAKHVSDRYLEKREKGLRIIRECEANGIMLTREQKEELFNKLFDEP